MKREKEDKILEKLYSERSKALMQKGEMAKKKVEMIDKEIARREKSLRSTKPAR